MAKTTRRRRTPAWRSLVWWAVAPCFSGFLPRAMAGDADALIRQALESERRLNYAGQRLEITWAEGASVAALVQEYGTADGQRRVECRIPGRPGEEVFIENGPELWYSCPSHFLWQRRASPSLPFHDRWQLLRDNYDFHRVPSGLDHVARRPAVVLEARPREVRKGYLRLWLDQDTHFILKIERYRADDTLVSKSVFETIRFNPPLAENLFAIQGDGRASDHPSWQPTTRPDLQAQLGAGASLPPRLPYGYQLDEVLREQDRETERLQAHLLYTDGLDTISLFALRPAPPRDWRQLERTHRLERLHGQPVWIDREGRFYVLTWQAGDMEQSLVTELPEEAVRTLATALIPRNAPPPSRPRRHRSGSGLPALLAAALVFLLLRRCLRPRWR